MYRKIIQQLIDWKEFAKKYYNYPECFSGHVRLDLGCISILKKNDDNLWEILKVNLNSLQHL